MPTFQEHLKVYVARENIVKVYVATTIVGLLVFIPLVLAEVPIPVLGVVIFALVVAAPYWCVWLLAFFGLIAPPRKEK